MKAYVEPLITADKILSEYAETDRTRMELADFERNIPHGKVRTALSYLVSEGYLQKDTGTREAYFIFPKGSQLHLIGGFKQKLINEWQEEQAKRKTELENFKMLESVTATNKAVTKNIKTTKTLTILALAIATVGAVAQVGDFILKLREKKEPVQQKQEQSGQSKYKRLPPAIIDYKNPLKAPPLKDSTKKKR